MPENGWFIAAVSVLALESLTTFHQRVATAGNGLTEAPGRLLPAAWDAQRRGTREHGVAIPDPVWRSLSKWAKRLAIEIPVPFESGSTRPTPAVPRG
jgi:hypothetical protein